MCLYGLRCVTVYLLAARSTELLLHAFARKVSDVSHHSGDRESDLRTPAGRIVSTVPFRVALDGGSTDVVKGDCLGVVSRCRCDHYGSCD